MLNALTLDYTLLTNNEQLKNKCLFVFCSWYLMHS